MNPPAMQGTWVWSLGQEDPPEEEMATHSSILARRIPQTDSPIQFTGSQTAQHKLVMKQQYQTHLHQRRQSDICSLGFQTKHSHFFLPFSLFTGFKFWPQIFKHYLFSHNQTSHLHPSLISFLLKGKGIKYTAICYFVINNYAQRDKLGQSTCRA